MFRATRRSLLKRKKYRRQGDATCDWVGALYTNRKDRRRPTDTCVSEDAHKMISVQRAHSNFKNASVEECVGDEIGIGIQIGFGVGSEFCAASALGSRLGCDDTRGRRGDVACVARTNPHSNFTVNRSTLQPCAHVFCNCSSARFTLSSTLQQSGPVHGSSRWTQVRPAFNR